jgi:serine/threonine protein kinase
MARPVLFGKYLLLDRISIGGMAEVFRAKSFGAEGFEKLLAIKRILPAMAEDGDFIEMFIDEAKIAGQLTHANICQIYELGCLDKSHFISMEYIWGKDALQLINRFRRLKGRTPLNMAAYIAARVCEGLDYAHRRRDSQGRALGIVHRDISPQNILVSYQGEVKIIDFGIAKAVSKSSKTRAGVLKGKFGYMSPEQVRGDPIDQRSDVFSLGTLLFELCTGERLFEGESDFVTLEKVRNADVPRPSSVNPEITPPLEQIMLKSLSLQADDRYQWASEFRDALTGFLIAQESHTGPRDLAKVLQEIFAKERKKERDALERYKGIGGDDLQQYKAPEGQRELAVSLLGLGPRPTKDVKIPKPDPAGGFDDAPTRLSARLASSDDVLEQLSTDDLVEVSGRSEELTVGARPNELAAQGTHIFGDEKAALSEPATQIFAGEFDGSDEPTETGISAEEAQAAVLGGPTVIFSDLGEGAEEGSQQPEALPPMAEQRTEIFSEAEPTLADESKPSSLPVAVTAIFADEGLDPTEPGQAMVPQTDAPPPEQNVARKRSQLWPRLLVGTIAAVVAAAVATIILFAGGGDTPASVDASEPVVADGMVAIDGARETKAADAAPQAIPDTTPDATPDAMPITVPDAMPRTVPDATRDIRAKVDRGRAAITKPATKAVRNRRPRRVGKGYLIANTTPWAKVLVDGRDTGKVTPIPRSMKLALTVGVHRITFRTQGRSFTYKVRIRRGKTTKLIKRLDVE